MTLFSHSSCDTRDLRFCARLRRFCSCAGSTCCWWWWSWQWTWQCCWWRWWSAVGSRSHLPRASSSNMPSSWGTRSVVVPGIKEREKVWVSLGIDRLCLYCWIYRWVRGQSRMNESKNSVPIGSWIYCIFHWPIDPPALMLAVPYNNNKADVIFLHRRERHNSYLTRKNLYCYKL